MAIERWFYHKFHHGLTLADVERYTHLLVGAAIFHRGAAEAKPALLARDEALAAGGFIARRLLGRA